MAAAFLPAAVGLLRAVVRARRAAEAIGFLKPSEFLPGGRQGPDFTVLEAGQPPATALGGFKRDPRGGAAAVLRRTFDGAACDSWLFSISHTWQRPSPGFRLQARADRSRQKQSADHIPVARSASLAARAAPNSSRKCCVRSAMVKTSVTSPPKTAWIRVRGVAAAVQQGAAGRHEGFKRCGAPESNRALGCNGPKATDMLRVTGSKP